MVMMMATSSAMTSLLFFVLPGGSFKCSQLRWLAHAEFNHGVSDIFVTLRQLFLNCCNYGACVFCKLIIIHFLISNLSRDIKLILCPDSNRIFEACCNAIHRSPIWKRGRHLSLWA